MAIKLKIQYILISISYQPQLITNIKPHIVKKIFNVMQFIIFCIYFNITVSKLHPSPAIISTYVMTK